MAAIEIDERAWPLVIMSWPEQPVTDADLDALIEIGLGHLKRGPHVVLHLSDGSSGLASRHRQRMAQYVKDNHQLLSERLLATAIVVKNPVIRGMVIAINWLAPPPFPQRLFAKRAEAEAWLDAALAEAGLGEARGD